MTGHISTEIIHSLHPNYKFDQAQWAKWRATYAGGQDFINNYLIKFSNREDDGDFANRKVSTPLPTFAKTAINDIRNAIFQRMRDITRRDGSKQYSEAVAGQGGGVDLRGSTMNSFMGKDVLTELLIMGKVGVYVDMPSIYGADSSGPTLADIEGKHPYLYLYRLEDIKNWHLGRPGEDSEFQILLLKDLTFSYDQDMGLPTDTIERHRLIWINQDTGKVNLQFIDEEGNRINPDGGLGGEVIELGLTQIPFTLIDIGDSLLKDVCQHQIALLNIGSSNVNYALKSNFPFYIEQGDLRKVGSHLKGPASGSAEAGGQGSHLNQRDLGVRHGREYDLGADAPSFIHPSSEPLVASMALQTQLEEEIRKLVSLAVTSAATRSSAESKSLDNQGLESGLSYIGLVMETAERKIAQYWANYEESRIDRQQNPVIKYPDRYNLKNDQERIKEASGLVEVISQVPSNTSRRELWKMLNALLLSGRVSVEDLTKMNNEIDRAPFTTSDPEVIFTAVERGIAGNNTASIALGFNADEAEKAKADFRERIALTLAIQRGESGGEFAARGAKELDADPTKSNQEKETSKNADLQPDRKPATRGRGKKIS